MNILMIGAHPDDCEFRCSGLAYKYVQDGHRVRMLSMCNGNGGHHELSCDEIAARRHGEAMTAAKVLGVEYDIWDIPDCQLVADLPTREKLIRYIREFKPDVIFGHRNNDYHADHRNAGLLLQDASYLLIVPNYCSDVPAMKEMPVILHYFDKFKNPPFEPDVVIDTTDVVEKKYQMLHCHTSQIYEWLPFTYGTIDEVPESEEDRYNWLKGDPIDENTPDEVILNGNLKGHAKRFAYDAALFRDKLIERYGEEKGKKVVYAESYAVSEYGNPMTPELEKKIFPY